MSGYVKSETHKGITSIEFFHPQSNSLPAKILYDQASDKANDESKKWRHH